MNHRKAAVFAALVTGVAAATPGAAMAQGMKPEHIRGTITRATGTGIIVKTREGETVRIALPAKLRISGLAQASLSGIRKGSYVGIAGVPQADGTLRAQEVLIFPTNMRGVGEGHRPWDLTPDSTMTNASVDATVRAVNGRLLTLRYKGGEKKVLIPRTTPVVTIVKGSKAMLKPGAHIFAVAKKGDGGAYTAMRIAVGVRGLRPPM